MDELISRDANQNKKRLLTESCGKHDGQLITKREGKASTHFTTLIDSIWKGERQGRKSMKKWARSLSVSRAYWMDQDLPIDWLQSYAIMLCCFPLFFFIIHSLLLVLLNILKFPFLITIFNNHY
jgi:hypothetical protein